MKKVILLGDSIRLIGYGEPVAEMLTKDGYEVWQPDENSRFCQFVLRQIFDKAAIIRDADVVHFNSGEWDICDLFGDGVFTDEQTYIRTMLRIVKVLKNLGVKHLIFATTTPVRPKSTHNNNDVIRHYNDVIVPLLAAEGCIINDLWSIVNADIDRFVRDDTIHLSDEAIPLCARQTVELIKKAAEE